MGTSHYQPANPVTCPSGVCNIHHASMGDVMSNSRTRRINYKPRMTQMEAYDALPLDIKRALQIGPQQWDTYAILRMYRARLKDGFDEGYAIRQTVRDVMRWHRHEVQEGKPWRPRKVGQKWSDVPLSPHVIAGAIML